MQQTEYRLLTDEETKALITQGCTCADWSKVEVAQGFQTARVRNAHLSGALKLGANGAVADAGADGGTGVQKPCGIFDAHLHNCTVGDDVRIAGVGRHIANYDVQSGACIENVGTLETRSDASFGNGVEVEVLNEGGGREVVQFDRLDSQFAHLMCLHRYRPDLVAGLRAIAQAEAAKVRSSRGRIGAGSRITGVKHIADVNVGPNAVIDGAASLANGTVLSSQEAPTTVGSGVEAEEFIIAEGTKVDGGAIVASSFVGQGCRIGKQFSAEGSLFFANCEGFHGEACSVFAGPYTVTHHKSTLLIAGLFSFYNAGSGTNQSNHLYKLGPVHEGRLERGCKTGSFSYMMWPCRIGPFSVVLGKHTRTFDTADFPFSYLEATPHGRCQMTPGFNLTTVGTVRDGAKWPARDRRPPSVARDRITFDVFSPLTVGRMIAGSDRMHELQESTDRSVDTVSIGGAEVKRVLLRTGQKFYRSAIHIYLLDKVVGRIEDAAVCDAPSLCDALAVSPEAVFSQEWVDIGGQIMPRKRLDDLCRAIESGHIADLDGLNSRLDEIFAAYAEDEWAWVRWAYGRVFATDVEKITADDLAKAADDLEQARRKFLKLVLNDAAKEFGPATRIGFGQDGAPEDVAADFAAVRGDFETNTFVEQMKQDMAALEQRIDRFKRALPN